MAISPASRERILKIRIPKMRRSLSRRSALRSDTKATCLQSTHVLLKWVPPLSRNLWYLGGGLPASVEGGDASSLHGLPEWVITLYLLHKGLFIIASFNYDTKTVGPCCVVYRSVSRKSVYVSLQPTN